MSAPTDPAELEQSWSDFLNNALDGSQRATVLKMVASDFNAAVARHADSSVLLETLGRVLSQRPLTDEIWPAVGRALSLAYGPSALRLMLWLIDEEDGIERRLDELAPMLDVPSEALLRDVLGRHADALVWSYFAWTYSAHEWRNLSTSIRQSLNGEVHTISVTVEKVNGEQITFESRANQLLLLARAILRPLNDLPPTAFTAPTFIETFTEQAQLLLDTLASISKTSKQEAG